MKRRILALILFLSMLLSPTVSMALGDNPPKQPTVPVIVGIDVSSVSQTESANPGSTAITVSTSNIDDGTAITAQLIKDDGVTPVTGAVSDPCTISNNEAKIKLDIPAGLSAGTYKIKVGVATQNIYDSSKTYTVNPGAPVSIRKVNLSENSQTAGTTKSIDVEVMTSNAKVGDRTSVQLVEKIGEQAIPVEGVSLAESEIIGDYAKVSLTIPASIGSGSYYIGATVGSATNTDTGYTVNAQSNSPAITGLTLDSYTQDVETAKQINVTVKTNELVPVDSNVTVSLIEEGTSEAVTGVESDPDHVTVTGTSTVFKLNIPDTIEVGMYRVKVEVDGVEAAKTSNIYKVEQSIPQITDFSTPDANLKEGAISGNLVITGSNFSGIPANNTVEFIYYGTQTVAASAAPSGSTATSMTVAIPTGLKSYIYVIKLTVNGKSVTSTKTLVIARAQTSTQDDNKTPDTSASPGPVVIGPIPGQTQDTDKQGVEFDAASISTKLANLPKGGQKEITLELPASKTDGGALVLNADAVKLLAENKADVSIKAQGAVLVIPSEVLGEYAAASVKINIKPIEGEQQKSILTGVSGTSTDNVSIAGPMVEFTITASQGDAEKEVTTFKKKIKIEISMEGTDISKLDTKKLGIYYLDEKEKAWKYAGGTYNAKTGNFEVEVNHLTKFAVMQYKKKFADVPSNHWAKDAIETLAAKHITEGMDANNFAPEGLVTRAQFATFLVKALGLETGAYTGTFTDVKSGAWYTPYIEAAQKAGIVQGTGDGRFSPDTTINREQMAVMIMKAYQLVAEKNISDEAKKASAVFKDSDRISGWAMDAVLAAQANGIIKGATDTTFEPKDNAKRAQVAVIIIRLLEKTGK